MKTVIWQLIIAVGFVAQASAEAPTKASPKALAAGADACKELGGGKCAAGAKLKAKAGNATVYRADGDQTKIAFTIEAGTELFLSPPVELNLSDCGAGKCVNLDKATPKLVEVKIAGTDAIALDITAAYTRQFNEPPKTKTSWQTRTFVVCGKGSKGWTCLTTSVGSQDNPCSAVTLSKAGELKYTCTQSEALTF